MELKPGTYRKTFTSPAEEHWAVGTAPAKYQETIALRADGSSHVWFHKEEPGAEGSKIDWEGEFQWKVLKEEGQKGSRGRKGQEEPRLEFRGRRTGCSVPKGFGGRVEREWRESPYGFSFGLQEFMQDFSWVVSGSAEQA
ncbi:hypothetical protein QOT17_011347 [Balamuthia mandrillaris]